MTTACIGLGSNLGNSLEILREAWLELGRRPGLTPVTLSAPYRSEPVNMDSSNWFVNAAGLVHTDLEPAALLATLLQIEKRFGRSRDCSVAGYQDRTLDLDLLLYGDRVVSRPGLEIPHPLMHERAFVLLPLCEIAPEIRHPVRHRTMRTLLAELPAGKDVPVVERISWPGQPSFD